MSSSASTTLPPRAFNFSAGPACLPEPVLEQAREDLWSIDGTGIGVAEHSHRGKVFDRIIAEAEADCRTLAGVGDDHEVLFLQGGATFQFAMVPMNFLQEDGTADYLDTGIWTKKAVAYARIYGNAHVAFDGPSAGLDHAPSADEIAPSDDPAYTWYCGNNTVVGTEYQQPPTSTAPLVCDLSSSIFSRPYPIAEHGMVIAGAQKNLGPAGCTLIIARKDFLARAREGLPPLLDYRQHAAKGSRLNTPPTFVIYMMGQVFKWILAQGGVGQLASHNAQKAKHIYDAIDTSGGFYQAVARPGSRSMMNVTFRTPSPELDAAFVAQAEARELRGLKGHRSVGGLRASIYNAFPAAGCRALADFMASFAQQHG